MGFIKEPQNIDLTVGHSVLTDDMKHEIEQAIAQYKKTGEKLCGSEFVVRDSAAAIYVKQEPLPTVRLRNPSRKAKI